MEREGETGGRGVGETSGGGGGVLGCRGVGASHAGSHEASHPAATTGTCSHWRPAAWPTAAARQTGPAFHASSASRCGFSMVSARLEPPADSGAGGRFSRSDQAHGAANPGLDSCAHSSGRLHFSEAGRGGGWRMSIQHHGQWPQGPWPLGPGAGDKAPAYRLGLVPRSTRLGSPYPPRKQQLLTAHVTTDLPSATPKRDCFSLSFSSIFAANLYLNNFPKFRPAGGRGSP